jgi:hypothetical protein
MTALVWCWGNVYYQVDYRASIDGKNDTSQTYTTTQTEHIKQLRVVCSKCTFTVYCRCYDDILDRIAGDLNMSSVVKHMKDY